VEIIRRAAEGDVNRTAVVSGGVSYSYAALLGHMTQVADMLLEAHGDGLAEARVAFLVPPSAEYVMVQWGIWFANGIAVPLATSHPPPELEYVIRDAAAAYVIGTPDNEAMLRPIAERAGARFFSTAALARPVESFGWSDGALDRPPGGRALMVYTSGTTGRPKGVVTTHGNITAQVSALIEAWGWRATDRTLLVLPLHHVHGIINVVCCALWAGASVEMLPKFDADETWRVIESGRLTVFMAVPTIYNRLIAAYDAASPERRAAMSAGCRAMRLMVSGSAALPVSTLERWRAISGHTLLERYGMTEMGMALSNPLEGERRPGFVGTPLPGVTVRLVNDAGAPVADGTPGEIQVKGPNVFHEYWGRPDATAAAFQDGWFRTGDTAVVENGYYRILGRTSVDILNPGGYKVSALEIEEVLRTHPAIAECAVVGVEDAERGEKLCVAAELRPGAALDRDELRAWARERLAPYKIPHEVLAIAALPRNAMGKVLKPEVVKLFGAIR
jgi:malonyl-CoA/methylmalonyl-CoA synthetase